MPIYSGGGRNGNEPGPHYGAGPGGSVGYSISLSSGSSSVEPVNTSSGSSSPNERSGFGYCATCFKENPAGGWALDANGRCPKHGGGIGQALGLTTTKKTLLGLGGALGAFLVGAAVVSSKVPKKGQ